MCGLELLLAIWRLLVLLQDGGLAGLLDLLDLAGRLEGLVVLIEVVLGCGDPDIQFVALPLQVPDLIVEPSLDFRAWDLLH